MIICDHCGLVVVERKTFCTSSHKAMYYRKGNKKSDIMANSSPKGSNQSENKTTVTDKVTITTPTVTERVTPNITDITQRVTTEPKQPQIKKKLDKNGFCPHFIAGTGYCAKCGS